MGAAPKKKLAICAFFVLMAFFFDFSAWSENVKENAAGCIVGKVSFENNYHISRRLLRKSFGFTKGDMITELGINEGLERIKDKYKSEGFYFVSLSFKQDWDENSHKHIKILIDEGVRVKIGEIIFSGNVIVPSKKLKRLITSKERGVFIRGYYDEERLNDDCSLIKDFYKKNYYLDAVVTDVIKNFSSDGRFVDLTFVISEQKQDNYTVRESYEEAESGISQTAADASEQEEKISEPVIQKTSSETSVNETAEEYRSEADLSLPDPGEETVNESVSISATQNVESVSSKTEIESFSQKQEQQNVLNRRELLEEVALLRSENRRLLKERKTIIQENETLSAFVEEKREVESLLSGFLSAEKSRRRHLEEELKDYKEKNNSLEILLKNEKERRHEIEQALDESSARVKKLLAARKNSDRKLKNVQGIIDLRLKDIESLRDNLTKIIENTKGDISRELDRIELTQIDIAPLPVQKNNKRSVDEKKKSSEVTPPVNSPEKDGRILVVNKDMNFVVINMGAKKEIYKGMVFDIESSPGIRVGACKVIEVRKKISAADLIEIKGEIKKGYKVYERKS